MKSEEFVVGLDFGTTKICAIVGQWVEDAHSESGRTLKILGVGRAPSTGIKKGVVVNIDATVEGIRKAVQDAELMAGVKIDRVIVGVAGAHIKALNSSGVVGIKGKEVSQGDIDRVMDAARAVAIPADRTCLHVLPQEFKVDDQDGIRDPLGMMGIRLEAKVHIVTAAQSALQNFVRCCQRVNLKVSSLVLQPLASARAVLSKDEMELGVALVDIGGGTTDLAIFHGGSIVHTAVLPLGGAHISQDLAIGLRTPAIEAERLKISQGVALKSMISPSETVEVPSVGGRPSRVVDRKLLGDIIEPRVEEILQLVNREIISSGCAEILGGGVVLTGGTTLIPGMIELAEFVLDLPVKRAAPEGLTGFQDVVASPIYSTAVGLVKWGADDHANYNRSHLAPSTAQIEFGKITGRLKTWFDEMF